jgi:hypothetical protein
VGFRKNEIANAPLSISSQLGAGFPCDDKNAVEATSSARAEAYDSYRNSPGSGEPPEDLPARRHCFFAGNPGRTVYRGQQREFLRQPRRDPCHRRCEFALTYIFISRSLPVVAQVATRIAVMRAGQFLEVGAAEQVLRQPKNDYTSEFFPPSPNFPEPERFFSSSFFSCFWSLDFQFLAVNFFSSALESPR